MTSIKWKYFPRYWPFVRGIPRSPVNSPHKGQWRGAWKFSLMCAWINGWVNNSKAGDLRCHRAHYDVIVMIIVLLNIHWNTCDVTVASVAKQDTTRQDTTRHGFQQVWPSDLDRCTESLQQFRPSLYSLTWWHGITLIPAWISNCIRHKVWDDKLPRLAGWNYLSVPKLQRCSRCSLGMDRWFHPHFSDHVITYSCWG